MKLQQILSSLQKLHPKEIDLSLDRIKKLCLKLGSPENNLQCISVVGTNGKGSTIQMLRSILREAGINCNIWSSPHIKKINERFIYNDKEISDENLIKLLIEVEDINAGDSITYFEILTAAYFYNAKKFKNNINLIESGLFHRADACSIIKSNLASIITTLGLDHLDWLPKNERTIDQIIFEKTSSLLNSKIIVSRQSSNEILDKIKKSIEDNASKKVLFGSDFSYSLNENGFFYYEDKHGGLKLPLPNLQGEFQLSNAATAIATVRNIKELEVSDESIKRGITKIKSIARFEEIKHGKLKELVKKNKIYIDVSHNPLGADVLSKHLDTLQCNKHIILGMMKNKDHIAYINYFKNKISSLTTVNIKSQPNAISGKELIKKLKNFQNINYKKTILEAIKSIDLKNNDIIIITGSCYLAGEVLNLN